MRKLAGSRQEGGAAGWWSRRRKSREGRTESVLRREWSVMISAAETSQKVRTGQ